MKLENLPLFFLDLQTTGSRPGESDILEMAWARVQDAEVESGIESVLVTPSTGFVPRRIQMITGITDTDMNSAVDLPTAFGKLEGFLNRLPLKGTKPWAVIHFAQFEKPFLIQAYQLLGKDLPFEILCTHKIAKRLMPNLPTRGIKGLAGYFGYNSGDLKRSSSHVEATRFIWQGLQEALQKQNLQTSEDLLAWLEETPAAKRKKYEYPLAKEKRLSLPDQPGVYRMISRWGEILYVGKATSLHNRVNSYFRGQKNRDARKLEMLTQAWDLQVTPCGSPLEAALLETDEIKRWNPRYNISLKTGARAMVFFNRDFTSVSTEQDPEHEVGPFSNSMVLDSMIKLVQSLKSGVYNPLMFFEPLPAELLEAGFALFCHRHGFTPGNFHSVRSILAVALRWLKAESSRETTELVTDDTSENNSAEEDQILEELLVLTAEDIADKFERHFLRAGRAYLRARQLTRLLNSDIGFQAQGDSQWRVVKVRQGQLLADPHLEPTPVELPRTSFPWAGLNISTYDRMSILTSELQKIKSQDGTVVIRNCSKFITY
jgi:DNA polymerase-3 subunit epsilon